jgi:hypothetical protein
MASYVDGDGKKYQRVSVQVWVPERMISWLVEHTDRSRLAAKRHLADQYLHHGGDLRWMDAASVVGIEDGDVYPVGVYSYVAAEDVVEHLHSRGVIPYLDDDGDPVREGGGLSWNLA